MKWFVINVGKGGPLNILANNQQELIEYCLSNVFEKLSENAKYILKNIGIKIRRLCYGGTSLYI